MNHRMVRPYSLRKKPEPSHLVISLPSDLWASKVIALFIDAFLRKRIGRYS